MVRSRKQLQLTHARWTCGVVWPALKRLAESELTDFSPLRAAAYGIPGYVPERWQELVDHLKHQVELLHADGVPIDGSFCFVVKALNEGWFIDHGLLLIRCPDNLSSKREPSRIWHQLRVSVGEIGHLARYEFADEQVAVFSVCTLYPPPRISGGLPCHYDHDVGWVVIDLGRFVLEIGHIFHLPRHRGADEFFLPPDNSLSAIELHREYNRYVMQRWSDPRTFARKEVLRALYEELRHAITGKRARLETEAAFFREEDIAYRRRLKNRLLREDGELASYFLRTVAQAESEEVEVEQIRAVDELSAQMTAAAVGPDPQLVVLEWWEKLRRVANLMAEGCEFDEIWVDRSRQHAQAAVAAITFLNQELGLAEPLTLAPLPDAKFGLLAGLSQKIAQRSSLELRLALKTIYEREFEDRIDESPFPRIGAEGTPLPRIGEEVTLDWRDGWQSSSQSDSERPGLSAKHSSEVGALSISLARNSNRQTHLCEDPPEAGSLHPDAETVGNMVDDFQLQIEQNSRKRPKIFESVRHGLFRKTSVKLSGYASSLGYVISDCCYSRKRIIGHITASKRPIEFPALWAYILCEKKFVECVLVQVLDAKPGKTVRFTISSDLLCKASSVVIEISRYQLPTKLAHVRRAPGRRKQAVEEEKEEEK